MKIEVSRENSMVDLKVGVDEKEVIVRIPLKIIGKLEAMLAKARAHTVYKGSLGCVKGTWCVGEAFDLNNP